MRRREFVGMGLLPLVGCVSSRRPKSSLKADVQCLERLTPSLMAEFKVPGAAMAVIQGGEIVWARGFGVRNELTRDAVKEDTLFEAASVSKTVFAYVALKLCERGVIGLDS